MTVGELELSWLQGRPDRTAQFEVFLRDHERLVLRTAWRMLGSLAEAQDAAQDVFLRLFKHFGSLDDHRSPQAWVYRVTVNVCYDVLRKRRLDGGEVPERAESANQDELLIDAERKAMLARALMRLPGKERAALVLRELEGLETAEVAAILGSSEATVRSQISIAKGKLRKMLEGGTNEAKRP